MSANVSRYDQACTALQEARTADDLREVIDRCEAIKLYARRAQNRELELNAGEIRHRAERRFGELIVELRDAGQLSVGRPVGKNLELVERVTLDELGASRDFSAKCQRFATLTPAEFESMLSQWRKHRLNSDSDFGLTTQEKNLRRAKREAELGGKICALPSRRYGVIVADPGWRFKSWSSETGMNRAAENHYPTQSLEDIKALDVRSIAARDCALGLWTTVPCLAQGLEVLASWGFAYKTHFVWAKDRIGPGYWNRNKHEIFLLATLGDIPCPAPGQQWDSLIEAPRRAHSEKPDCFLEMLEQYFPTLPKVELHRRGPGRKGWDVWGNESVPAKAESAKAYA